MAGEGKTILVYDDFSTEVPVLLGKLYVGVIKGERYILLNMIKNGWQRTNYL